MTGITHLLTIAFAARRATCELVSLHFLRILCCAFSTRHGLLALSGYVAFAITFHNINSICQLPLASSPTITMSLAGNAFRRSVEYHAYFSPSENFNQNVKSLKSLWALLLTGSCLT